MFNHRIHPLPLAVLLLPFWSCDFLIDPPLVTMFDDTENAVLYEASDVLVPPTEVDTLLVMTWNIRFGAARLPWFGDSCGDRVILTKDEVTGDLQEIADKLNEVDPDVLILQEVDVESKRSAYTDQVRWLLERTSLNYGAYASMWQSQFVPSDGLGRINTGNAILTRWRITEAERIALPLRADQDALTTYFYLRRNMLKVKIDLPGHGNFYALGVHAAAFSTDDTKRKHIERFKQELDNLDGEGELFVAGGDLNEVPPGSDSTDYCDEDWCPDDAQGSCRDGSDFTAETDWLNGLYRDFSPAVSLNDYLMDNSPHFTHSVGTDTSWNRKLDYLFTTTDLSRCRWVPESDSTHQDAALLSDHAPVSARLVLAQ